jgi:O-acetyl-ADP-ribose deacetylase (regulator of RNase III)
MTQAYHNKTHKWIEEGHIPSGWGHIEQPNLLEKIAHFAYQKLQYKGSHKPGSNNKS